MKQPYDDSRWKFAATILDTYIEHQLANRFESPTFEFESRLIIPFRELEMAEEELLLQLRTDLKFKK